MTIPADQIAGFCCPQPTLQFDWHLGTEDGQSDALVVALSDLRCLNCGTFYRFKGTITASPSNPRFIVLDVEHDRLVPQ